MAIQSNWLVTLALSWAALNLGSPRTLRYQPARSGLLQSGSWGYKQKLEVLTLKHGLIKKFKKNKEKKKNAVVVFMDWNLEGLDHADRF